MAPMTTKNEPRRLDALSECGVLDTAPEADFDNLTRLAADICGCPIAYVALVDSDRQWFKSRVGLTACQTGRSVAFCAYVVAQASPLIIEDASRDPRFADNPLVTGEPFVRFHAGFPLILSDGAAIGTFCVADTVPRKLNERQIEVLGHLASQARSQLELRRMIEHLKRSEESLRTSHDDLEIHHARAQSAARAKGVFLTNMSHEIRTPMTAILGFTDLLASAATADERAAHAEVVRHNAQHLLGVIDDVLEVANLDSDSLTLSSLECDPRRVLTEMQAHASQLARAKRLMYETIVRPDVPHCVRTDPNRLRQIVLYLTTNALKFTEAGGVRVELDAAPTSIARRTALTIRISDTGAGISDERLDRLFKPFAWGDDSASRDKGGTGLGLYIARRLCRLMGGDLTVESQPGKGSTFTATIIVQPVASTPVVIPTPADNAPPPSDARGLREASVLVVEDGLDNQRLLKSFLTRASAKVTIARDGQEALDLVLRGEAPISHDLILMDMQMPRVDGYEATRRLREAGIKTPIIAVTSHALAGEREKCLQCGCDDYQIKPIDRPALLACCERWLDSARTGSDC